MLEYAGGIVRGDRKGFPRTAYDELTVSPTTLRRALIGCPMKIFGTMSEALAWSRGFNRALLGMWRVI
jgi:hypothetical protein